MKYTNLNMNDSGESYFEDIELELNPVGYAPPAPPMNIAPFAPATRESIRLSCNRG